LIYEGHSVFSVATYTKKEEHLLSTARKGLEICFAESYALFAQVTLPNESYFTINTIVLKSEQVKV
jgi:hypothetical protein